MAIEGDKMSRAGSLGSAGSLESESDDGDPSLAEREKALAESVVEVQDVEMSLAFVNIRDQTADKK